MRARALGFDFDHTLGIDNKLERVAFLRLLQPIDSAGGSKAASLSQEAADVDALLAAQRSGGFSIEEAVDRFVRGHGLTPDPHWVTRYKENALSGVDAFVVPMPGWNRLREAMREMKLPYALLTNGWNPLQKRKAESIGFDGPVIASADIGAQKPSASAFQTLAGVLGVPAEGIWYVGDNPIADVAGSLAVGMRGIWLDAEGESYPAAIVPPSEVIHSLDELAVRLTQQE
ncbi:MAG: HAD family hydrolase [Candidatus Eremiobacteraeota bacterium]|nr:HAD family hydrolase [Candidatus Eremiobacteraeota bacterium]